MQPKDILKKLIDDKFGGVQAAFARAIKRQPAQVNQWLSGNRKLDGKGQRLIEKEVGLPSGYMSGEPNYSATPAQSIFSAKEPTPLRPLVQQVIDLAERIDDAGLNQLVGFAHCLTGTHPRVKAKPELSA